MLSSVIYTNSKNEPMPLFIIYKNGTCGIEVTKDLNNRNDVELAVGGIQLLPYLDFTGFKPSNILSLSYATQRIAIARNPFNNKVCLIGCKDKLTIEEFKDRIKLLKYDLVLGLDSGGSAQWKFDKSQRLTGRYMIGWLYY